MDTKTPSSDYHTPITSMMIAKGCSFTPYLINRLYDMFICKWKLYQFTESEIQTLLGDENQSALEFNTSELRKLSWTYITFASRDKNANPEIKYLINIFEETVPMRIKVQDNDAKLIPIRGTPSAAGFDLKCAEDKEIILKPMTPMMIDTGVVFEIPNTHCGIVSARSGLASKDVIMVMGGIIDSDYRGTVRVILFNASPREKVFNKYDKIAQILFHRVDPFMLVPTDTLSDTARGTSGFGSTGV
jgi:dUTP pyrophosphatase